ncbi:hypothetical protein SMSP2_01979 [Limihaloglobus sulfuriphilus]|uniref:Uncharacterized protein n=1 Tax=Limihaloglobus sulfuriphilus TaxID=1851148 RepID=A0A1Q2MFZ2_9BACT|nr:hypothetical protein [Limihaloglobus sulfuriphilus]AQQ71603.1 hypothetical protein SMSP2_01979 [Limihaloglobus sulfuriphilus]
MKDDNTMDYPWMYYYDNKGRMVEKMETSRNVEQRNLLEFTLERVKPHRQDTLKCGLLQTEQSRNYESGL